MLPRPNGCYIFQKQGVQGFKILYWLSSFNDKDKDKDMVDMDMVDMDMVDMDKMNMDIRACHLEELFQKA